MCIRGTRFAIQLCGCFMRFLYEFNGSVATRRASKGVTCSTLVAANECSQRGRAWLFLITAHAIKSHTVVASLKSSGVRICKPFVKAATRRSWRLSRVISAQYRGEGRDAWQFLCRHARRLLFISLSRIFYANTLLLYSPHVKSVFRGYEWRILLRERTITFYHPNTEQLKYRETIHCFCYLLFNKLWLIH